jgi:XTP/dITP diphosphohydrolase
MSFPEAAGSADSAGSALLRAVEVMDRLRSAGGCPWDAEQTHDSLRRYLVEECYELLEAIEQNDDQAIREELGDVLLQVLFHARIAAERTPADGGFDIDDVAAGLVDKLIRRHPHVFGNADAIDSAADQQVRWDALKRQERGRSSVLAGVALGQPAVALAAKIGARAAKAGVEVQLPAGDSVGEQLFRLAFAAGARGEDPELELRAVAKAVAGRLDAADPQVSTE